VPPGGVVVTCGYVTVPEDRSNLKSKSIKLAVEVFHSTGSAPAPDPVVFLQGGPGGEAVHLSTDNYDALVKPFLSVRDFVAFDQRGTGISIPALGCEELEKVYKQDIGGSIPASSRELVYSNAFRSCHGSLTIAGSDLNAYTTVASSDDLKDIISALGYKQVDLYGVSYGTRLALVTLRDHPGIVRSVVLDSVVPIEVKLFNEDPVRYGSALQALFDACAADLNCNTAYPDLKTTFWNLVDQLDTKPASVTTPGTDPNNTGKFDGADLIGVTLTLLKSSALIGNAPEIIYQVKSGDYSIFSRMQSVLPYQFQGINLGLYISMMCHEQILATNPQDLQAVMDTQLDIGRYFRLPFFGDAKAVFNSCKLWGAVPPDAGENAAVISDIPALVIAGKYDPVTPPIFGTEVVSNLSHAYSMEFPNLGHTPSASDSSGCALETILAFFDNPGQQPDMTCLSTLKSVDFVVP
jgi:pimeloyl-ACP methyl ester carboxylesterase